MWGISRKAPIKEKLKSELNNLLKEYNSTGILDYPTYSYINNTAIKLLEDAYSMGTLTNKIFTVDDIITYIEAEKIPNSCVFTSFGASPKILLEYVDGVLECIEHEFPNLSDSEALLIVINETYKFKIK